MPNHWGMGIWANGGGKDPISGDVQLQRRLRRHRRSRQLLGADSGHGAARDDRVGLGLDAPDLEPDQRQQGPRGPPVRSRRQRRLERLGRRDLEDGHAAGLARRGRSRRDRSPTTACTSSTRPRIGTTTSPASRSAAAFDPTKFVPRGLKTYTPDLWGKLAIGSSTLEGELVGQFGTLATLTDQGITGSVDDSQVRRRRSLHVEGRRGQVADGRRGRLRHRRSVGQHGPGPDQRRVREPPRRSERVQRAATRAR